MLLDRLCIGETALLKDKGCVVKGKEKKTPVEQTFGVYLTSQLQCLHCKHLDVTFDLSTDVMLDILPRKKKFTEYLQQPLPSLQNLQSPVPHFDKNFESLVRGQHKEATG